MIPNPAVQLSLSTSSRQIFLCVLASRSTTSFSFLFALYPPHLHRLLLILFLVLLLHHLFFYYFLLLYFFSVILKPRLCLCPPPPHLFTFVCRSFSSGSAMFPHHQGPVYDITPSKLEDPDSQVPNPVGRHSHPYPSTFLPYLHL